MTDATSNRKPADQLHDIREQIRQLRDQEHVLRAGMISGEFSLEGDEFTVVIDAKPTEKIDLDQMRQHVPESVWRLYLIEKPVTSVNCRRKPTYTNAEIAKQKIDPT